MNILPTNILSRKKFLNWMGAVGGLTLFPSFPFELNAVPMSITRKFHQVDVFTNQPLLGNALAVVHDASGLSDETLAAFARWTNLSETTFLFPSTDPDADYKVRIFTTDGELPFAGHPTLGSCHAWLAAGGKQKSKDYVVQECGVGLVKIRMDGNRLAFAAPPLRKTGAVDEATLQRIADGLHLNRTDILHHQWVDNGPGWCAVMIKDVKTLLAIQPDFSKMKNIALGVIAPQPTGSDTDFEVRSLFWQPTGGMEDPVTGSLNAGVAQWLIGAGLAKEHYVVSQGTVLKRKGRIYLDKVGDNIWVGGETVICVEGTVSI